MLHSDLDPYKKVDSGGPPSTFKILFLIFVIAALVTLLIMVAMDLGLSNGK